MRIQNFSEHFLRHWLYDYTTKINAIFNLFVLFVM